MDNKINIVLIPVDNRPVSFTLPAFVGRINIGVNILLPPREFLGGLKNSANIDKIFEWLEKIISGSKVDFIICALDTLVYGGLITSRRCEDTKDVVLSRFANFKKIIKPANAKIFAFSSVMRISDSNVNEEEKPYWDKYGKLIFNYSVLKHKVEYEPTNKELEDNFLAIKNEIPAHILQDYSQTRERNFAVNKIYLNDLKQGIFDFLIYAKDDTAPLGINVQEANELKTIIEKKNLVEKAILHTGSDEVITMLVARAIKGNWGKEISVFPVYSTLYGAEIIPRYEDQPLCKSINNHLQICNIQLAESKENADMILLLHTTSKKGNEQFSFRFASQNDFALGIFVEPENEQAVDFCIDILKNSNKPVILADVCCANGADNLLTEKFLMEKLDLYGFAAWNTASNSIGSALATGIVRCIAEKENNFSVDDFNKLLFIRFADDWAYQSNARQKIRAASDDADEILLCRYLIPYMAKIASKFDINPDMVLLSFPWGRTFEVEINVL